MPTKKENKLEVQFQQFGHIVIGKVLHQDESLRSTDIHKSKDIYTKGTVNIRSSQEPAIVVSVLYIRGTTKTKDNQYFVKPFLNEAEAARWITNATDAINEVNKMPESKDIEKLDIEEIIKRVTSEVLKGMKVE